MLRHTSFFVTSHILTNIPIILEIFIYLHLQTHIRFNLFTLVKRATTSSVNSIKENNVHCLTASHKIHIIITAEGLQAVTQAYLYFLPLIFYTMCTKQIIALNKFGTSSAVIISLCVTSSIMYIKICRT